MSSTTLSVGYQGNRDSFPSRPTLLHFYRQCCSYGLIFHTDGECSVLRAQKSGAPSITVPDSWEFCIRQPLGITEIEVTCNDGMISIRSNGGAWEVVYVKADDEADDDEADATDGDTLKNGDKIPPSRFSIVVNVQLDDGMTINLVIPPSRSTRHVSVTSTGWEEVSRTVVNRR